MKQWLLNIRQPGKRYTVWEGIRRILLCLVLGILLGMLSPVSTMLPDEAKFLFISVGPD